MKKLLTFLFIVLAVSDLVFSQGEIDDQDKIFFRNERTIGFNLSSNGYGLSYREGKRLNYLNKAIIDIELNEIKHPKEIKLTNPYIQNSGSFVFGKENNIYSLRASIGRQHEMYVKADRGGVSIKYFYSGGLNLAMAKPVYYNVIYISSQSIIEIREEKFSNEIHNLTDIYNRASFLKGFGEISFYPGAHIKAGLNFEYSKEDKIIHAIEIGSSLEAYTSKLPIMATDDNRFLYLNVFVTYRLGFVIDPLDPESTRMPVLFFKR